LKAKAKARSEGAQRKAIPDTSAGERRAWGCLPSFPYRRGGVCGFRFRGGCEPGLRIKRIGATRTTTKRGTACSETETESRSFSSRCQGDALARLCLRGNTQDCQIPSCRLVIWHTYMICLFPPRSMGKTRGQWRDQGGQAPVSALPEMRRLISAALLAISHQGACS
jgi:hypothetical protein